MLPVVKSSNEIDQLVVSIDLFVERVTTAPEVVELDKKIAVVESLAKKFKATEDSIRKLCIARIQLALKLAKLFDCDDWREVAASAGMNPRQAGKFRGFNQFSDETLTLAFEEIKKANQFPGLGNLHSRAWQIQYPVLPRLARSVVINKPFTVEDEYVEPENELGKLVSADIVSMLDNGEPLSISKMAEEILASEPELILALDPEGKEVLRERLKNAKKSSNGWPTILTVEGSGGFSYISLDHATVGHARAHLDILKMNLNRVLSSYNNMKRLVKTLDGLPDGTKLDVK